MHWHCCTPLSSIMVIIIIAFLCVCVFFLYFARSFLMTMYDAYMNELVMVRGWACRVLRSSWAFSWMLLFILLSHAILFNHFNCVRVAVFYLFRCCCRSCLLFKPQNNNHAFVVAWRWLSNDIIVYCYHSRCCVYVFVHSGNCVFFFFVIFHHVISANLWKMLTRTSHVECGFPMKRSSSTNTTAILLK